jgi:hypothetical protein
LRTKYDDLQHLSSHPARRPCPSLQPDCQPIEARNLLESAL